MTRRDVPPDAASWDPADSENLKSVEKPLEIAILGCGSRGRTYAGIATSLGGRYRLTAVVDPVPGRAEALAALQPDMPPRLFAGEEEFFRAGRLADVCLIATQDADHHRHACRALEAGYDLVLEKPAGVSLAECEDLDQRARCGGRRIALCFVLRYTPFYRTIKRIVDSGRLGRIVTLRLSEGVEPFHQAHSFVRGHWSVAACSTPMIVAKCSHDADLLCWLGGAGPAAVASFGDRAWFRAENAPAEVPARCTDGCPHAPVCPYDAHRYLGDKRRWLGMVLDRADSLEDGAILEFLRHSPWGRCVYRCDNDVVDHQVLAVQLANGVSASLTMTAFDEGRSIEVHGTAGSLRGGDPFQRAGTPSLWLRPHGGEEEAVALDEATGGGYSGHGGGDGGLIDALESLFRGPAALAPGLDGLAGHRLAFWAEQARVEGRVVKAAELASVG